MKNTTLIITLVALVLSTFPTDAFAACRWVQGKGRVCTPVIKKNVVVVNPHYRSVNPWLAFSGVIGTAIIIDKVTGEPTVEGKDSIVVETKLVEAGKVDVIDKDGKVIFIKGVG